jgi:hypothetical protein
MREGDQAPQLKQEMAAFISQELKMALSDEKTAITDAREGFDFLGVRTVVTPKRSDARKLLPYQFPATKSVKAYRNKVRELTHTRLDYLSPGERMRALNWLIQGWANYHRWGNAKAVFSALSYWTCKKVHKMLNRYTPEGKHATYRRNFWSVSECSNLRRWKRYTHWLTPSVAINENIRLGVLPMAIISTKDYWRFRGQKIPPAYQLRTNETEYRDRETDFYTDLETIAGVSIGQASRRNTGKYSLAYFHNRRRVFQWDNYTCTVCGYKSQRQKGEVHDLEVHHANPDGGFEVENLRRVCLPCHHRLTAIR